jgi:hypothetical protein
MDYHNARSSLAQNQNSSIPVLFFLLCSSRILAKTTVRTTARASEAATVFFAGLRFRQLSSTYTQSLEGPPSARRVTWFFLGNPIQVTVILLYRPYFSLSVANSLKKSQTRFECLFCPLAPQFHQYFLRSPFFVKMTNFLHRILFPAIVLIKCKA